MREQYTGDMLMSDFIIDEFYKKMNGVNLDVYGLLDSSNSIHTLGTDSKIIGRVFEMITQPILEEIAANHNLSIKTPESQTVYPDFVLMENEESQSKIAIDIKTTYIKNDNSNIKFTLGSFGSYMRNNTKNIEYKYTDYAKHYVIGFIYKRNDSAQSSKVISYEDKEDIVFPYYNVKYFIQEKYKIAGDKPGSGNTENLGSFGSKCFNDFKEGNGPFAELGQDVFDIYWKYYPKYRSPEQPFTSLEEFVQWYPKNSDNIELLHSFDKDQVMNAITTYVQQHQMSYLLQESFGELNVAEP